MRLARLDAVGLVASIEVANHFRTLIDRLLVQIRGNEQIRNLLNGVYLPIIIPQTNVVDLGETTERFLEAAEKSYKQKSPRRSFTNYPKGQLVGQVTVAEEGSRYEQLLDRMARESFVALYFPNPLQGYSVRAQREQMTSLPEGFILSGPLDTAIGWVMYPDVLLYPSD